MATLKFVEVAITSREFDKQKEVIDRNKSFHVTLSVPPENIRKLLVFYVFKGYKKRPAE